MDTLRELWCFHYSKTQLDSSDTLLDHWHCCMFLDHMVQAMTIPEDSETQGGKCHHMKHLVFLWGTPQDNNNQGHKDLTLDSDVQARSNGQLCMMYNLPLMSVSQHHQVQKFQADKVFQQTHLAHSNTLLRDIHQTILDCWWCHREVYWFQLLASRSSLHHTDQ